jgi:predicted PurR-regulated permease PerM
LAVPFHFGHFLWAVFQYAITLGGTSVVGFLGLIVLPPILSAIGSAHKEVEQGESWKTALKNTKFKDLIKVSAM